MDNSTSPYLQFICRACGLIYDEALGDPDSGLAPGTRFADIPDDWECPLCGVTKKDFEPFTPRDIAVLPTGTGLPQDVGVIIVGAGLAGWSLAEAIRELDVEIPITLISACSGDRYHKPELSVALSRSMTSEKLVRETAEEAALRLRVRLMNNTFAVGLASHLNQLRTTRGILSYTKLVLAQGARSILPDNLPAELCWRINELRGWQGLQESLSQAPQRVAIVGAGMIGCELAEDIVKAGHEVTLINRRAYPLASLLPEKAGLRLLSSFMEIGITHLAETEVSEVKSNANAERRVIFKDGSSLLCDQVIAAVGLTTHDRLARHAGLEFDNGITVNPATLRTSNKDIYALGDCISLDGEPCRFVEPITHQSRTIAKGIVGSSVENYHHQQPVIRLKTRSLPVNLHGLPVPGVPWEILVDEQHELVMEQRQENGLVVKLEIKKPRDSKAA